MYRRFRVSEKVQSKIKFWFALVFSVLLILWYVFSAIDLQLSIAMLQYNNEQVANDDTKVKVEHIDTKGRLHLSNTKIIEDDQIKQYIKVPPGTGTYYIPESYMSTELTKKEGLNLGLRFIILDWLMVFVFLYWAVWRGACVGYLCVFLADLVVLRGFTVYACSSPFPVSWLCLGRITALFGLVWFLRYRGRCRRVGA